MNYYYFEGMQVLKFEFQKFRILEILNLHPWRSSLPNLAQLSLFSTEGDVIMSWVKVFRIIPEFRILRLTFQPQNAELEEL